jgi:signal transduction histidine kinase
VFVLGYAAVVFWMMQTKPESFERLTRVMFVLDIGIVSAAMLVFSSDPSWTTWVIGSLIIIAGGFRFGTAGAFTAAGAISLAYVAIAAYRSERFGLVGEPWRLAFHVSVFILAAYMMSGLLRELEHLRAQREKFVRQAVEAAALRQADRIKSEFLAAMSHDFRSPLTVVRGAVELLLGERPGTLTAAQRELAESAERNIRRLEDFTAQLLEMARLEEGQVALDKEEIDAIALVRDVVADHAVLAKQKRQWISLDVDPDPPHVVADRSKMHQALTNLIVNAIRYAPQGTPILVMAHRRGDALRIEVRDHGPGIATEDRQRIFDKFFRGQNADGTPGSGLGLAIARSLVTLHGGTLEYEENPGGGSAFVTLLPLAS